MCIPTHLLLLAPRPPTRASAPPVEAGLPSPHKPHCGGPHTRCHPAWQGGPGRTHQFPPPLARLAPLQTRTASLPCATLPEGASRASGCGSMEGKGEWSCTGEGKSGAHCGREKRDGIIGRGANRDGRMPVWQRKTLAAAESRQYSGPSGHTWPRMAPHGPSWPCVQEYRGYEEAVAGCGQRNSTCSVVVTSTT